jgi:uncharacterized protein (DUF302 family)
VRVAIKPRGRQRARVKSFLYTVETKKSFEAAVEAVENKVVEKGFSVVHTYDVASTLAAEGFHRGPLKIVGVCNARYTNDVLKKDVNLALMMPCPIVVYTEGEETLISTMRPGLWLNSPRTLAWKRLPNRSRRSSSRLSMRRVAKWFVRDGATVLVTGSKQAQRPERCSKQPCEGAIFKLLQEVDQSAKDWRLRARRKL